ncbi:MAG: hybrid sensor histidine kinase/response regulator [Bacteroidales bacterium]|nr:hybrid sensor histidine kinase/response regulator [Bacteroidales bacterium]
MNQVENKMEKDVILVVDDQPNNLKVIASVLGRDYSLSIANSGANALKILENNTPDLILLDIMMPEIDGFEVCRRIKSIERISHIPVIFLSAKNDIDDVVNGFRCGAVDYITKPFNSVEVKVRVQNHLNLKHALDQLRITNQKLEELNATKDKFFSIIAHDLRSPFTSIIGFSELLYNQIIDKDYESIEQYAGFIKQSSKQAMELLTNLLEWARSQTGKIEYNPEKLNLTNLIEETALMFDQIALPKNIIIKRVLNQDLEVVADKHMIATVMRNLISNAVKFTAPGGEISVSAQKEEAEIIVNISDNGVGIPSQRIDNIFQIDNNNSTLGTANEEGTGLGLILCKMFVEKSGGWIKVMSEEGKGSVFSFSIRL